VPSCAVTIFSGDGQGQAGPRLTLVEWNSSNMCSSSAGMPVPLSMTPATYAWVSGSYLQEDFDQAAAEMTASRAC